MVTVPPPPGPSPVDPPSPTPPSPAPAGPADAEPPLAAIRSTPLSVEEVLAAVADPGSGGHALFAGTVRDDDEDRPVTSLRYEAHPGAERVMAAVVARVREATGVRRVAALHRVGELAVGDLAVVVAASAAHRAEALEAARRLIDEIKAEVPIWKLQRFAAGEEEWVGSP
jgi:molybdopterin synthase catalytic subunit